MSQCPRFLTFRKVNRRDSRTFDPQVQKHHLLPCQAMRHAGLRTMIATLGVERLGFDDFARNGLLLPTSEGRALGMGLPLHRGPHRHYNELVIERLGAIESWWSPRRARGEPCHREAIARIGLLQRALRRRLLNARRPLRLSTHCPIGQGKDFTDLDRMAEALWRATGD